MTPSNFWPTWTVKKDVVILYMAKTALQPVKIIGKVLHAKYQSSIGTEPQRIVLHDIIHFDQFPDVWKRQAGPTIEECPFENCYPHWW